MKKWTKEEINIVQEGYKNGLTSVEIAKILPDRTSSAIRVMAHQKGLNKYTHKSSNISWTKEEIEIITKGYDEGLSYKEIALKVPDRTIRAIETYIQKQYGTKKQSKKWTESEDYILTTNYSDSSMQELQCLLPNRSEASIRLRAFKLGLTKSKRDNNGRSWSATEEYILTTNYSHSTMSELQSLLPNRSFTSIRNKATKLGLAKSNDYHYKWRNSWSQEEDYLLIMKYQGSTMQELQRLLPQKSATSIKKRASKLNLIKYTEE